MANNDVPFHIFSPSNNYVLRTTIALLANWTLRLHFITFPTSSSS
jgi:hypothetical protein